MRSWATATAAATRTHRHRPREPFQGLGGHVLELGGHGSAGRRHLVERSAIGVGGLKVAVRHLAGGTRGIGIEHEDPVSHHPRPQREHPAELPTTQHPQRRARQDHAGSWGSCDVEHPLRLVAAELLQPLGQLRHPAGRGWRRRRAPAFCAPAAPMAKVGTGMPAGICTIESSESSPWRCLVGHRNAEHRERGLGGEHAREDARRLPRPR